MIENVLRDIGGIGLYGVISVCLFFLVFSLALVRACRLKEPFLNRMSTLPLQDGTEVSAAVLTPGHTEPDRLPAADEPASLGGPGPSAVGCTERKCRP